MAIAAAFADRVHGPQETFRAVMEALARPGSVRPLAGLAGAPAPLSPTAAAVAVALADFETPLFLDGPLAAAPDVAAYLAFHTGARIAARPDEAAFALIAGPAGLPAFDAFSLGTDAYPDRSATLIVQVEGIAAVDGKAGPEVAAALPLPPRSGGEGTDATRAFPSPAHHLLLEGPGIKGTAGLAVAGLPADIAPRLAANRALFPRGVDLILAGPSAVAGLPRTTRVREA